MVPARYRIVRTVASGGMAHVYEAIAVGDSGFERRVAIKRILPHLEQRPAFRDMFLYEARLASRIHHGSIVQVLDYGEVDGGQFIVMEYVDGVDAEVACQRGQQAHKPMSEAIALHITCEVANALHYVHGLSDDRGQPSPVVHRDISPQNILLSWEGDVKLSDFGIAFVQSEARRTGAGVIKGKAMYMAPEQLRGERGGTPADIYALGATLHALLVGTSPQNDQSLAHIMSGEAIPLSPNLSRDAAQLIAACMHPLAARRPTADQLAEQAGRLAQRRLSRDGRGELRTWLTRVGRVSEGPGGLDDLMGIMLVQTPQRHTFRFAALPSPPLGATSSPIQPFASPASTPGPGRGVGLLVVLLLLGMALIAGAAGGVYLLVDRLRTHPASVWPDAGTLPAPLQPISTTDAGGDRLVPNIPPDRVLSDTGWIEGELTTDDPRANDNSFYDQQLVQAPAGATIWVAMKSTDFDTYVMLYQGETLLAVNDDVHPDTTDAQLQAIAPTEGEYRAITNSVLPETVGTYRIRVVVAQPGRP